MRYLTIITFMLISAALIGFPRAPIFAADTPTSAVETFTPEVFLPGVFEGDQTADDTLLSRYIRAIYIYFIWTVGIIATVMVIYGGIRWVGAAGNPAQIKEARDIIDNAIIGVIIGLTSVVLLNIINPKLAQLSIPKLSSITKEYVAGVAAIKACPPSLKVRCGDVRGLGVTTVTPKGTTTPAYCIGTLCHDSGEEAACSLLKTTFTPTSGQTGASTWYAPNTGCITSIPLPQPRPAGLEDVTSLPVKYSTSGLSRIFCGFAYTDKKVAGLVCDPIKSLGSCYIAENVAQLTPLTGDPTLTPGADKIISSMQCAQE